MTTIGDAEEQSIPRRQTDPAWLQDHFLGTGHSESTHSATFTFIKRRDRYYAVTCGHVIDALKNSETVPNARHPTLALHLDKSVLNLSSFIGINLLAHAARKPHAETPQEEIDIAIAPLSESYWSLLASKKNKTAIDLDNWREPRWDTVKFCLATGYPDEHKEHVVVANEDKVSAPFMVAVAEVGSKLSRTERIITLSSRLEKPHGYFFSGMSGGAVYACEGHEQREVSDDELFPVAIIFEGYPGSGKANAGGEAARTTAFLTDSDIFFRALTLTPESFDEWLKKAGIGT